MAGTAGSESGRQHNLHYALHHARRTLEPFRRARASRYLVFRGELLELCPGAPLWVDAEAFEEAAVVARRTREPATYRAVIGLYTGDLLPQDRYEAWAEDRREGLRRLRLRLLVELAGLCEESADPESAIEALVRAVADDPTDEEAQAGLVRLYALTGRRHEAVLQYERLRKVRREELGAEPGEAIRRLHDETRAGRLPASRLPREEERPAEGPKGAGRHNLPAAPTSFVGRERELAELKRELARSWLVTLTGPGGVGKTRLALETARGLVGAYPDGVWRVGLVGLSEGGLVLQAVAAALGVREVPGRPLAAMLAEASKTRRTLLVLDNCEHLLHACARLAEMLLSACAGLRVLATSRQYKAIAERCMAEYDLYGWTAPDLINPDDVSLVRKEEG